MPVYYKAFHSILPVSKDLNPLQVCLFLPDQGANRLFKVGVVDESETIVEGDEFLVEDVFKEVELGFVLCALLDEHVVFKEDILFGVLAEPVLNAILHIASDHPQFIAKSECAFANQIVADQ